MRRELILVSISLCAIACGSRPPPAPASAAQVMAQPPAALDRRPSAALERTGDVALPARVAGDFAVYRFTGALRSKAATLTERVVAVDGDTTVVDYTLEEAARRETMRVTTVSAGGEQRIASAALVDGVVEGSVPTEAVDAFLSRVFVIPEANAGALASERATVEVAGRKIPCTKTTYKIRLDRADATMSLFHDEGFAWGDLGAEIQSDEGVVLYRAELVGEGSANADAVVARAP